MVSEQEASKELMVRNWSFTYFEALDRLNARLKELGISPDQVLQLIEAANEIKDVDFRAAAFDLLELKKRTGKSSKEAEAYIKELDSQITSKEKQSSDWTARIEKAKSEFRDWEQKHNDERAKFESEQARNKRILKEDGEKLNQELSENNEVRENIEETIGLKAELRKISLDLATFKSIVKETVLKAGISPHIAKNIREAVKNLGSLDKAIAEREKEEKARKKAILNLSGEERERKETLRGLDGQIAIKHQTIREQDEKLESKRKLLESWNKRTEDNKWQYEFFELFIGMLLNSPSAPATLPTLGLKLQELSEKGWRHSKEGTSEERRAAFIIMVMGVYLHSIHCGNCGASFIVNKPSNAYYSYWSSYYCPVCHFSSYTKSDDTFFDLMVSPELGKKFQDMRNLLDMMGKTDLEAFTKKLKLLDSFPSEVYKALSEGRRIEVKILDGTN
jgi:transposase-like protein